MSRILVTGGSGFVASHTIARLFDSGHEVCTTVRDPARETVVRELIASAGRSTARLSVVVADLLTDDGWSNAVHDCEYVLHIASPFPASRPKSDDELVVPAREGTLRVLRAARDAGVRRVVLTSSFAAVGYGHPPRDEPFTEADWTNPVSADVEPYILSKVAAERAAWDFLKREGGGLELSAINPVGIFGPVLGRDYSSSIAIVERMLRGAMPACPRLYFGVVDVRDVADLQLLAMTAPEAAGERFLAVAGDCLSMLDVAEILRDRLGDAASRVPTRELPDWLVRMLALFRPELRPLTKQLGKIRRASSAKARNVLGWSPRDNDEAIDATGESLVQIGVLHDR